MVLGKKMGDREIMKKPMAPYHPGCGWTLHPAIHKGLIDGGWMEELSQEKDILLAGPLESSCVYQINLDTSLQQNLGFVRLQVA